MCKRFSVSALLMILMHAVANAGATSTTLFVDGRWSGGTEMDYEKSSFTACWASTKFDDGTTLSLAKQSDTNWYLRLSNPGWHLQTHRRYEFATLVDFYPRLRIAGEVTSRTSLQIESPDQSPLVAFIENGHTIDFNSNDFTEKYDLEGSAKAMEKIRDCFARQTVAE